MKFDCNAIQQPTLEFTFPDEDKTTVNLSFPSTDLIDRFIAMASEIKTVAKSKDGKTIRAVYQLVADIMSCNEEGFTFTAEELRDKYKLSFYILLQFVPVYFEFIQEAQNAKN